jgi:hypothetical protein
MNNKIAQVSLDLSGAASSRETPQFAEAKFETY